MQKKIISSFSKEDLNLWTDHWSLSLLSRSLLVVGHFSSDKMSLYHLRHEKNVILSVKYVQKLDLRLLRILWPLLRTIWSDNWRMLMSRNAPLRCEQIRYQTSTTSKFRKKKVFFFFYFRILYKTNSLIKIGRFVFVASIVATANVTSPLRSDPVKQWITSAEDCLFSWFCCL